MKVDFIIIGGQKCGTTALHYLLNKHPKIIGSNPKEVDFFNYDFNFKKGVKYYHSFFKKKHFSNIRGIKYLEASPSYINGTLFTDCLLTANRIYEYNPNAKIMCLVRNPIDRAFSAYNMFKKRFETNQGDWWFKWFETRIGFRPNAMKRVEAHFCDFELYVEEELDCLNKGLEIECPILDNGKYVDRILAFKKIFKDNLIVIENEVLLNNTKTELERISEFLEVNSIDWSEFENVKVYQGNYINKVSSKTMSLLKEYYRESNEKLFKYFGVNYN